MRKQNIKPIIRWMIFVSVLTMFMICVSPVTAFIVIAPNDTMNRYYQDPDELHQYALYSSVLEPQERENVEFFPGNYSYPDPMRAYFNKYNETFPCDAYGRFEHLWDAGTFPVFIIGDPGVTYSVGWILCEEGLTGKVCDRPPLFMPASTSPDGIESYPYEVFDNPTDIYPSETVVGVHPIEPLEDCCMKNGMSFWEAVPNGVVYPSQGDWDVPFNGTRYYSEITADDCRNDLGLALLKIDMDQTIKDGTYKLHIQEKDYNPGQGGTYGYVNAYIHIQRGMVTGPLYIESPYSDSNIYIDGLNYDSKYTYLWITGQNLPKCGMNLVNINDSNPTVVNVSMSGKWEISWDPSALNIGPGSYEIWYSSVDPNDPNQRDCITCANYGKVNGICALKDPNCQPCGVFGYTTTKLDFPITTAVVEPVDVERCCCPGSPCGLVGGNEGIWVKGISEGDFTGNVLNKTLQIWIFGEGMVGDKPYLFKEVNYLCDGSFDYDLNEILAENDVALCDLAPGKYFVIVQSTMYNNIFDVTLQGSNAYQEAVDSGALPVNEKTQTYVVSGSPVRWSKSFVINGIDAMKGVDAVNALTAAIDEPGIDDQYALIKGTNEIPYFVIKDNKCAKSVDFVGTPVKGYAPLSVDFMGTASFDVVDWAWDFEDDGLIDATTQNATHTYLEPGIYSVKLTASDKDGIVRDNVKFSFITVNELLADFSFVPNPANTSIDVQFMDQSIGAPTTWTWEFGDGSTSTHQNPRHKYEKAGVYTVSLTVGDSIGTSPVKKIDVPVYDTISADFSVYPEYSASYPAEVQCTDLSMGTIQAWRWEFIKEGKVTALATEQNPEIVFNSPGIYDVKLTVSNTGNSATALKSGLIHIGSGNSITIMKGWNHVSVPNKVSDEFNTVGKLFAGINSGGIPYAVFSNELDEWENVTDSYPVRPLDAVRVWKDDEGIITIQPTLLDGGIFTKNLTVGWNGIGIMAMQPTPANVVLESLGESWTKTLSFNPVTQLWDYPIIRGVDDDKMMDPTVGYLIEMNSDGILTGGESE